MENVHVTFCEEQAKKAQREMGVTKVEKEALVATVSLNSQRLPEKLPEVTGTSRGNPEFPEVTRERLGESFFNVS